MRSKLNEFRNDLSNCPYDVILINETWLQDQYLDTEIITNGWSLFRKDRARLNVENDERGGGVFIAVKDSFFSSPIQIQINDAAKFDFTACRLQVPGKQIYIGCFYIPPNSNREQYELLGKAFYDLYSLTKPDDSIFIYGDSNLRNVNWLASEFHENLYDPVNIHDNYQDFLTMVQSLGLYQINNLTNTSGNVLDTIFTNVISNFILTEAVLKLTSKASIHHRILSLDYIYKDSKYHRNNDKTIVFDYDKADYASINREINNLNLNLNNDDVNNNANELNIALNEILEKYVPKKTITKLSCPVHFDKSLRMLRNKRNKAFNKYKRTKNNNDYNIFLQLRNQFKEHEEQAIKLHKQKVILNSIDDPKQFWNLINEKRKGTGYPLSMSLDSETSDNSKGIANLFAKHFESVFENPLNFNESSFDYIPLSNIELTCLQFELKDVAAILSSIDTKKGAGPDNLHPKLLKNTANTLSKHLTALFNASLKYGIFPDCWKTAYITPIFKSGNKSAISNYRGISLLSSISKIFEKLVLEKLNKFLSPLICENQHGFGKGKSTTTNLTEYCSLLRQYLTKGKQVDAIYTDFSKAFDKVDHHLLLFKLQKLGIRGSILSWIKSYLTNRSQIVKFQDRFSYSINVTSGVPQGSVLGPILFAVFINDIASTIQDCHISMYADDLKIFKAIVNETDSLVLQSAVDSLSSWCRLNGMFLNVSKCSTISFSRSNSPNHFNYIIMDDVLDRKYLIKDLGILIDAKLTFKQQIDKVTSSGHTVLGFVKRRAKEFNDPYLTKNMYCSLVRPILEYASIIWSPYRKVDIDKIESVQKQFLLFALRNLGFEGYHLPSYNSRLRLINMISLENRRELAYTLFAYDLINDNIKVKSLKERIKTRNTNHNLRRNKNLVEEQYHTDFGYYDTMAKSIRLFNKFMPNFEQNISRTSFKNKLTYILKMEN